MPTTVGVREPPDPCLRQAQREAVARVNWRDLLPKLEAFAVKRGASSSEATDVVQTAIAPLLDGRTAWNPVEGPDMSDYMMAVVRRILGHERKSARLRYEAPPDTVDNSPDPQSDPSSTPEATENHETAHLLGCEPERSSAPRHNPPIVEPMTGLVTSETG
jgi:DNA-directed RNA polymerase specialized sigma24 family protein